MLGQPEADSGRLDRHLRAAARSQIGLGQLAEQPDVLVRNRSGLARIGCVLTEEVDADQPAAGDEPLADGQCIGSFLAIGGLISAQFGDRIINMYTALLR